MSQAEENVTLWQQRTEQIMIPNDVDWSQWMTPEDKWRIKNAPEFKEKLKHHYLHPEEAQGLKLPWIDAKDFNIRHGESTIHSGYRGHKKSMMLGMIQLGLISQDEKCLGVSLEMPPHVTLARMLRQFTGQREPNLQTHDRFFEFLKNRLFLYDQIGTVNWKRAIAVARYAITEHGITQVFYDSLMKLGIKKKDLETQAEFVDEMTTLGKDTGCHFHLVAHSNKSQHNGVKQENLPWPTIEDVSGSSDLTNMVDNVVIHYQDKNTEHAYEQVMNVDKQRNPAGDDPEPSITFDFDSASLQFQRNHHKYRETDWEEGRWM